MRLKYLLLAIGILIVFSGCEKKEESKKIESGTKKEIKITQGAIEEKHYKEKSVDKGQFYYSYKEAKKTKSESKDEAKFTKLGAYRYVKNPYLDVQLSLLVNKLSKNFLVHCSACHDDYANGVIGPSLLDKSGDYIYKQLIEFKTGKRKNVLMHDLTRMLSDKELKDIADEIARFNKKVKKVLKENKITIKDKG